MNTKREVKLFNLSLTGEDEKYNEFVNTPGAEIIYCVDALDRQGNLIRVVEIRRTLAKPNDYTPPIN